MILSVQVFPIAREKSTSYKSKITENSISMFERTNLIKQIRDLKVSDEAKTVAKLY